VQTPETIHGEEDSMLRLLPGVALCIVGLVTSGTAQGALPLAGIYAFGQISAEQQHPCGGNVIYSDLGQITFLPDGTFSFVETEHEICETGSVANLVNSGLGLYVVALDGQVTLNPGAPDELRLSMRPDERVMVAAGDETGEQPSLLVAARLSGGLSASVLSGVYHCARYSLANPGTGTSAQVWQGKMSFSGAGSFSALLSIKTVATSGATTFGSLTPAGTYSVLPDGRLTVLGLPGAPTMQGAVTGDGGMFFVVDATGQDVALIFGFPEATAGSDLDLAGPWQGGNAFAFFGPGSSLPEFCSNTLDAQFVATPATYTVSEQEVCDSPFGGSSGSGVGSGTYSVAPDGSLCLYDSGFPPCAQGAVNLAGTLALAPDMVEFGELGLAFFLRTGELPTPYGTATAGTGGLAPGLLGSGGFAYLGNPDFAFEIKQGLGGATALIGLAVQPLPGLPALGGMIWINPATLITVKTASLSASGAASSPMPIPFDPTLDGATVHAQVVVMDPAAPAGFAMSTGLKIPLHR
jgi:hypothetical protein